MTKSVLSAGSRRIGISTARSAAIPSARSVAAARTVAAPATTSAGDVGLGAAERLINFQGWTGAGIGAVGAGAGGVTGGSGGTSGGWATPDGVFWGTGRCFLRGCLALVPIFFRDERSSDRM